MAEGAPALRLDVPRSIHVVYVGGKAMSAIAEILVAMGHRVSGSDPNDIPVLERLRRLGVRVEIGADAAHLGDVDVVLASTAVRPDHPEVVAARARGIPVIGRPAAQGAIARTRPTIAVSGTHGKTTTTAMLVHLLEVTGRAPSYIVGGDVAGSAGGCRWVDDGWFVVEADESDGTFLELGASRVVVTNVEADHLDHYGTLARIEEAFDRFLAGASDDRVVCADDPIASRLGARHGARSYGTAPEADLRIVDLVVARGATRFGLVVDGTEVARVDLPIPGAHNAANAAAAILVAEGLGVPIADGAAAMASYGGVGRRFERRGEVDGIVIVDDYAHNPGKVRALVAAAAHGGWGRVVVVVQPHRYSRTDDVGREFATSFDGADVVVVTAIDPAGEPPRPGVTGQVVADAVRAARPGLDITYLEDGDALVPHLVGVLRPGDLCLTVGAGDITGLADRLIPALQVELVARRLGDRAARDAPLGALTTYRVGGAAALRVDVESVDDLRGVAAALSGTDVPVVVVGKGSNMLVADAGFPGVAVVLGEGLAGIDVEGTTVRAGGAASLPVVARRTAAAGLTGFEWAVGVPGSIGGAVRMNAGGHGSDVAASLHSIHVVDLRSGEDVTVPAAQLALGYRRSDLGAHQVVVSAELHLAPGDRAAAEAEISEIVGWRRANQPGGQNAGSVFTNPPGDSAGRLIDVAGAKGLRLGTAAVSEKHANFIQADPGGSADDVRALMEAVRRRVAAQTGVDLHPETHLVGFDRSGGRT